MDTNQDDRPVEEPDSHETAEMDLGNSDNDEPASAQHETPETNKQDQQILDFNNHRFGESHLSPKDHIDDQVVKPERNIVKVTNVSPLATLEQLTTLFSFLGHIVDIELQKCDYNSHEPKLKVCFVEFAEPASVLMAQHLTNTVFIDRAILVAVCKEREFPSRRHRNHSDHHSRRASSPRHHRSRRGDSRDLEVMPVRRRSRSRNRGSRRSRSRELDVLPPRRRSRSRQRSRRSRSRDKQSRQRSRSRESKSGHGSKTRSAERNRSRRHRKSSRR